MESNANLEERLKRLEERISILENRIDKVQRNTMPQSTMTHVPNNVTNNTISSQRIASNNQMPIYNINEVRNRKPQIPQKKDDFESFLGKNVFTIIASVLIFIGVIVFASVLLPHISQQMKFILMCIGSILFTALGFYLVKKKQSNFSIGVLACGLGTVYITLLTGNLYFHFINTILLYIALLMWAMVIYYCSRYKSVLFNIIGQCGIVISLIICLTMAMFNGNREFILFSVIYAATAEILYDFMFKYKGFNINMLSMLLCVFIISFPVMRGIKEILPPNGIMDIGIFIAFLILLAMFLYIIFRNSLSAIRKEINNTQYALITIGQMLVFIFAVSIASPKISINICTMIYSLLMFILTEIIYYNSERNASLTAVSAISLIAFISAYHNTFETPIIPGIVLLTPFVLYALKTKTTLSLKVFYWAVGYGTLLNFLYTLFSEETAILQFKNIEIFQNTVRNYMLPEISAINIIYYILGTVFSIWIYDVFSKHMKENDDAKIFGYLCIVINTIVVLSNMTKHYEEIKEIVEATGFIKVTLAIGIQYVFCNNDFFDKNKELKEQRTFIAYSIVNALMMIQAVRFLYIADKDIILYVLASIETIFLFSINSINLLNKPNTLTSVYVGIKITYLILVLFHAVKFAPFVTIAIFVWSIACIVLGLKMNQKQLRLYGLILALFSAVKLVLLDISYSNTVSRAFSYIICGGLCFLISYIYNRLEKNQNNIVSMDGDKKNLFAVTSNEIPERQEETKKQTNTTEEKDMKNNQNTEQEM